MAKVEIKSMENGPNVVFVDDRVFTAMCRCGASHNAPYCDGTHAKIGFNARTAELRILN
jgi:CDGSH-type Zn-finger protein